jgi:hypothetical protein
MRLPEIVLVMVVAFHNFSCAKLDPKIAAAVVAGAEQAGCTLVEVLSESTFAGVVCNDVAGVVSGALGAIKTDVSAASGSCQLTPLYDGSRYVGEMCLAYHDAADRALKARARKAR